MSESPAGPAEPAGPEDRGDHLGEPGEALSETAAAVPTAQTKSLTRRIIEISISVLAIIVIFVFVIPQVSGSEYGEVWGEVSKLSGWQVAALVIAALVQIISYGWVLMSVLPGLKFSQGVVVNQASTAVSNVVPFGGAIGIAISYAMLVSWNFSVAAITLSIVVSGFWNIFVKLGLPVIALALLAFEGDLQGGFIIVAAIGVGVLVGAILVFTLVLKSDALARSIGRAGQACVSFFARLVKRPAARGWDTKAVEFRNQSIDLVSANWLKLTASTILFYVLLYVVLLLCLRFLGIPDSEISWIVVFGAFAFSRLLSALPITPGGLGFVEAGTIGLLTAGFDGSTAAVAGAVLLWRALTFFLPVPLGALSYMVWALKRGWRVETT